MSRLAATGNVPWPEARCGGPMSSAQGQIQGEDTPTASPESISGRWQRDPAGQVGSIELLDAQYLLPRARDPRLAGNVRRKGSGGNTAPPFRSRLTASRFAEHPVGEPLGQPKASIAPN